MPMNFKSVKCHATEDFECCVQMVCNILLQCNERFPEAE